MDSAGCVSQGRFVQPCTSYPPPGFWGEALAVWCPPGVATGLCGPPALAFILQQSGVGASFVWAGSPRANTLGRDACALPTSSAQLHGGILIA
jgi:hypothetical protein